MDAELKAKWVEALRSGKYRQTRCKLHHTLTDSFCCLGVLCVVGGQKIRTIDVALPDYWRSAIGITLLQQNDLISMNDELKSDFGKIADYIEANL